MDRALPRSILDAAAHGDLPEVVSWIGQGGHVDARCAACQQMTILMAASLAGQKDVVRAVVEQGGQLDLQDADGMTALMTAVEHNHAHVVAALIKAGASVGCPSNDGETALIIAAAKGVAALVHMLLRAGASVDAVDSAGDSALVRASRCGHVAAAKTLLKGDAAGSVASGRSIALVDALVAAAAAGRASTVGVLLGAGVCVDEPGTHGLSGLQAARAGGHVDVADLMERSRAALRAREVETNELTAVSALGSRVS